MTAEGYIDQYGKENVKIGKNGILFFGAKIFLDTNFVPPEEEFIDTCTPVIIGYADKEVLAYDDSYCLRCADPISQSQIAVDFPKPDATTCILSMNFTAHRGAYTTAIITHFQGKTTIALIDDVGGGPGYISESVDGLLPEYNRLWDVYIGGNGCPSIYFDCPVCRAYALHYLKYENNEWRFTKPGEYPTIYSGLLIQMKNALLESINNSGGSLKKFMADMSNEDYVYRNISHQVYYSIMNGASDEQCLTLLHEYLSEQCAKKLYTKIKNEALAKSSSKVTNHVFTVTK